MFSATLGNSGAELPIPRRWWWRGEVLSQNLAARLDEDDFEIDKCIDRVRWWTPKYPSLHPKREYYTTELRHRKSCCKWSRDAGGWRQEMNPGFRLCIDRFVANANFLDKWDWCPLSMILKVGPMHLCSPQPHSTTSPFSDPRPSRTRDFWNCSYRTWLRPNQRCTEH